jgi:hypothetical protein
MTDTVRTPTHIETEDRDAAFKAELDMLLAQIDKNIEAMEHRAPRIAQLRDQTRAILDQDVA